MKLFGYSIMIVKNHITEKDVNKFYKKFYKAMNRISLIKLVRETFNKEGNTFEYPGLLSLINLKRLSDPFYARADAKKDTL